MPSDYPPPGDTVESRLSETQAPPPTAETAPQRQLWSSTDHYLPPTIEKPPKGPAEPVTIYLSSAATYLYTLSYLVFFSIFGTLARLGLQWLTFYPGAPVVTSVLWANVGGSLVMGFLLEDRNIFREEWGSLSKTNNNDDNNNNNNNNNDDDGTREESAHHKSIKKTIPLYIGLTTGFCGSFTSFSSFIRDIFLAISNDLPDPSNASTSPRNGGCSFMALVGIIITEVSLSLSALIFGSHLALALGQFNLPPTIPFRITRRFIDPLFAFLGWGCWLGAIFLAIWPPEDVWRGRAVFSIVFAPLGCLLRFYLSLALNARIPAFPLGTFTVNIFGSMILAMCFDLQRVDGIGASITPATASSALLTSCQVLQGVMDGFCGSATTVSTWVTELNGLKRRLYAYIYGVTSVGVALGIFVIVAGSLRWTLGFVSPVCE